MQYGDPQQIYLLQMLLSGQVGGATNLLSVAYLVCLFGIIIFKPERIRNLSLFRRACFFFAISIIAPSLISLGATALATATGLTLGSTPNFGGIVPGGPRDPGSVVYMLFQLLAAAGPLLLGASVLCALISIVPTFIPPPDIEPFGASREDRPLRPPVGGPPTS